MYLATQRLKQQEVYKLVNVFCESAEIRYTHTIDTMT